MSHPRLRAVAGRLLALGLGVGLALGAGEIAVRLVRPQGRDVVAPGLYAPDPPRRFALQPGFRGTVGNRADFHTTARINRNGMRGPEVEPKQPGRKRILVIGDSFAFGWGVEEDETLCARLADVLATAGTSAECLNGGIPGYQVADEVAWLEAHGLALAPDVVVIAVYAGNDIKDAIAGADPVEIQAGLIVEAGTRDGLWSFVDAHSHLIHFLKTSLPLGPQRRVRALLGLRPTWRDRILHQEMETFARDLSPPYQQAFASIDASFARLAALGQEHGFRPLGLIIPHLVAFDPAAWRRSLEELEVDPARYDPGAPTRRLGELFAKHAIPALDVTAELAARVAAGEKVVFDQDQHWNRHGNEVVARRLAEVLAVHPPEAAAAPAPAERR